MWVLFFFTTCKLCAVCLKGRVFEVNIIIGNNGVYFSSTQLMLEGLLKQYEMLRGKISLQIRNNSGIHH